MKVISSACLSALERALRKAYFQALFNKRVHIKKNPELLHSQCRETLDHRTTQLTSEVRKPKACYYLVIRTMKHKKKKEGEKKAEGEYIKILPITFWYIHHQSLLDIKRRIKAKSLLLEELKKRKVFSSKGSIICLLL